MYKIVINLSLLFLKNIMSVINWSSIPQHVSRQPFYSSGIKCFSHRCQYTSSAIIPVRCFHIIGRHVIDRKFEQRFLLISLSVLNRFFLLWYFLLDMHSFSCIIIVSKRLVSVLWLINIDQVTISFFSFRNVKSAYVVYLKQAILFIFIT